MVLLLLLVTLHILVVRLLLKIPHYQVREHREIKLVLTWKLCSYWVAFIVLEGAVHTNEEENHQSYLVVNSANYTKDWLNKTGPQVQ